MISKGTLLVGPLLEVLTLMPIMRPFSKKTKRPGPEYSRKSGVRDHLKLLAPSNLESECQEKLYLQLELRLQDQQLSLVLIAKHEATTRQKAIVHLSSLNQILQAR